MFKCYVVVWLCQCVCDQLLLQEDCIGVLLVEQWVCEFSESNWCVVFEFVYVGGYKVLGVWIVVVVGWLGGSLVFVLQEMLVLLVEYFMVCVMVVVINLMVVFDVMQFEVCCISYIEWVMSLLQVGGSEL